MSEFIEYCGPALICNSKGYFSKSIIVAAYAGKDGSITLQPESAKSMSRAGRAVTLSKEEYNSRPQDPYNNIEQAKWALRKCGFEV